MMKLERTTSGQCRSKQGAKDLAALRSVLSTARKQDLNCIAILTKETARQLAQLEGSWERVSDRANRTGAQLSILPTQAMRVFRPGQPT